MWKTSVLFFLWRNGPIRARAASFFRLLDHTQRHTTVGETPLDEESARLRHLYLTTHNIQETDIHTPAEFEPVIPATYRPQTLALDRSASGINTYFINTVSPIIRAASQRPLQVAAPGSPPVLAVTHSIWLLHRQKVPDNDNDHKMLKPGGDLRTTGQCVYKYMSKTDLKDWLNDMPNGDVD